MIAMMAVSAYSSYRQGQAQAQQARFQESEALANAAAAAADAKESERIATAEATEVALEAEKRKGAARVRRAAGGGRTDVGTNFALSLQDDAQAEWEIFKAGLTGRRRTERFTAESLGFIRQAKQYGIAATTASELGILGAGTSALGQLGRGYDRGVWGS